MFSHPVSRWTVEFAEAAAYAIAEAVVAVVATGGVCH